MHSTWQSRLLAPLLREPAVLLTSWDRDGAAVETPAHIAVAGDHAFIRTYDSSPSERRLRRTPRVTIAPAGRGPAICATARPLRGPEATIAARALRRKYPLLHGFLIPRLYRLRGRRTVYYRLDPAAATAPAPARERDALPAMRPMAPTI